MNEEIVVFNHRECGEPQRGGVYATTDTSSMGALAPFTFLGFPFFAEVSNPRKPQIINIRTTLKECMGLTYRQDLTAPHRGLPEWGAADMWGARFYTPYTACMETFHHGCSRRISPSSELMEVPTPIPLLVLHNHACMWHLDRHGVTCAARELLGKESKGILDEPWKQAEKLGYAFCPDFVADPYEHTLLAFYRSLESLKCKATTWLTKRGILYFQGVLGLTWITSFRYILKENEDAVPPSLAKKGVLPGLTHDDKRSLEVQ